MMLRIITDELAEELCAGRIGRRIVGDGINYDTVREYLSPEEELYLLVDRGQESRYAVYLPPVVGENIVGYFARYPEAAFVAVPKEVHEKGVVIGYDLKEWESGPVVVYRFVEQLSSGTVGRIIKTGPFVVDRLAAARKRLQNGETLYVLPRHSPEAFFIPDGFFGEKLLEKVTEGMSYRFYALSALLHEVVLRCNAVDVVVNSEEDAWCVPRRVRYSFVSDGKGGLVPHGDAVGTSWDDGAPRSSRLKIGE